MFKVYCDRISVKNECYLAFHLCHTHHSDHSDTNREPNHVPTAEIGQSNGRQSDILAINRLVIYHLGQGDQPCLHATTIWFQNVRYSDGNRLQVV